MRLINVRTRRLQVFVDPPPYAILSHRWADEEITYEAFCDFDQQAGADKSGHQKILHFCSFISRYMLENPRLTKVEWAWVDTVCIDKRSSAELSEAINSMWSWYWNCEYCVAYLADVVHDANGNYEAAVKASEWFGRGWTLQELLAPSKIVVCDRDWQDIGRSLDLITLLSAASGIPQYYLTNRELIFRASVARRMSWASRRKTTRKEDIAYCLFGLFEINLPLLYGEGERAFIRLQQEIISQSDDESILAWDMPEDADRELSDCLARASILAPHPRHFWLSQDIYQLDVERRTEFSIRKKHLILDASLAQVQRKLFLLKLNCGRLHPRGDAAESKLALGRFCFVPKEQQTENFPSFESRGCVVPLTLDASGVLWRTHDNAKVAVRLPNEPDWYDGREY